MLESFTIGVRVRLIDGVSGGMMGLSRAFARGNMEAKALQGRIDGIKRTMMVGAGLTIVGGGMLKLVESTLPAAKEYANQLSLMNTLGMKQADVARVVGQAWKTTFDVPTTSITENLKSFRELRSVFGVGHEAEAAATLPLVGKIQGILTALTGHEQERVGFDLVKAIELRQKGVMTQGFLNQNADMMAQTLIGMGGTLTVGDFHGALKMGKANTADWSDEFVYKYLPTLMQELKTGAGGAQSAGTYLSTFSRAIHGHMQKSAYPLWIQSGLINASDVVKNATGQWQMKPGAVRDTKLFEENPFAWVQKDLRPAVMAIMTRDHLTLKSAVDAMFSDRNAAFTAYNMLTKAQQYERDKATVNSADSLGAYQKLLKTNPQLAEMALQKQWNNIKAQIGFTLMPDLMKAASILVPQLVKLSEWINKNPKGVENWVKGFTVVGGLLATAGSLTIVVGALKSFKLAFDIFKGGATLMRSAGLITAAFETVEVTLAGLSIAIGAPVGVIVGVGAAIVAAVAGIGVGLYQMWRHWDSSRTVFQNLQAELGMFVDWVKGIPSAIWSKVPGWLRNILGAGAPKPDAAPKPPGAAPAKTYLQANGRLDVRAVAAFWGPNGGASGHAAGMAVGQGVVQGVRDAHPAVRAATGDAAQQAVAGFKAAAGIHSPSRVFAGLGDMLVQGLIVGLDRSAPSLLSRLGALGRAAMGTLSGLGRAGGEFTQHLTGAVAQRASQAMAFFRSRGWTGAQAAGIVANLVRESGLNPLAVNRQSGALGIAQWLGSRVRGFEAATGRALRGSSLISQLGFVDRELRSTHAGVGRALAGTRTPGAAAALINGRFEINGVAGEGGRRASLASQLAALLPTTRPAAQPIRFGTMPAVAPVVRPTIVQRSLTTARTAISTVTHVHRAPPPMTPLARLVPAKATAVAAKTAEPQRSPYVRQAPTYVEVHHKTTLDGRVLTETVTRHQAHDASRPHAGTSTFDPTMSAAPVGLGYHP